MKMFNALLVMSSAIKTIDLSKCAIDDYKVRFTGCLVLSHDSKLLLQQRGDDWSNFPGRISTFGGRIEKDETPSECIIRELHEELGALVDEADLVFIGALTEAETHHKDLIYEYFWHDTGATITGCYEGELAIFDQAVDVLSEPLLMDDARWLIEQVFKGQV